MPSDIEAPKNPVSEVGLSGQGLTRPRELTEGDTEQGSMAIGSVEETKAEAKEKSHPVAMLVEVQQPVQTLQQQNLVTDLELSTVSL